MKKSRQEAINDLVLALAYLTRFNAGKPLVFMEEFWKNYDFSAIDRLDEENYIINPGSKHNGKYAYLTEAGCEKARDILASLDIEDKSPYDRFEIRYIATPDTFGEKIAADEAEQAAAIEAKCFPPNEACSREHMIERIRIAPEFFLVAINRSNGRMAGYLNGIATDEWNFRDEFFTDTKLHDSGGDNVMLLGLSVLPEYRKQNLGRELVYEYCRKEKARGRLRLVLTCLKEKVKMYSRLGFIDCGESKSSWGGVKWHEMDITLRY